MGRKGTYVHSCVSEGGFALIEVLIALAISLVITGATWGMLISSSNTYDQQKQIAWARENVRVTMRGITKKVLMAGYDPSGANRELVFFYGITWDQSQLQIKMDLNGDGVIGSGEDVVYRYDGANKRIIITEGGLTTGVARDIQEFAFQYLDRNGNPTTSNSEVRTVRIKITGQTGLPDRSYGLNNGYRMVSLTTDVSPRNLALN